LICSLTSAKPLQRRRLNLRQSLQSLVSPDSSPQGLPVYAEALATSFANASPSSSSCFSTPRRHYDPRVLSYVDVSAIESDADSP
jgi:hypothetical protein